MRKITLLYIFLLAVSFSSFSQSFTVLTSTVPTSLNTCNQTQVATINIENPSSFLLTGVEVIASLPQGISYVAGTVTGATESNITNLNNPEFTTSNILTLTNRTISFEIETNCDVLTFLNNSGIPQNSFIVNYVANGNNISQNHTSNSYNIAVPNLSVTSFTNQSIPNGTIGGNFTRCLTITNGGSGYLEEFTMTDVHGTGVLVNSVDIGTLVNSGQTETITFTSADFMAFGDNDGRFETGESITICEDITVLNCSDVPSDYDIYWGCGGQQCQNTYTSANINFGFTTPNLKFASYRSDLNSCHGLQGDNTTHGVTIANIGNGDATNAVIDIYQGWTNAYYSSGWLSTIDTATITATINGGTPFHISADSTVTSATYSYSCPSFSVGQMFLNLPTLQPNDTIVITWEVQECDIDQCTPGRRHSKGWHAKGVYYNICDKRFDLDPIRGRTYDYYRENIKANLSPANITSGNTETFNFLISEFELSINNKDLANDNYWYQIILPPCLTFANNFQILDVNDSPIVAAPSQIITSGDTVFIKLDDYGNRSNFDKGQLIFDLTANCASCGNTSGNYSIDVKSFYSPDTTCPNKNEFQLACFSQDIFVLCPVTCEGLNFIDFNIERTNIGVADNDNNGLPDAINTPDLTKIRLDRVMYQDTLSMSYKSYIGKTGASPDFQYLTYNSSIASGGDRLTFIDGEITIFDLNTGTAHISTGIGSTNDVLAGTTRNIDFEIDINTLAFVPALPGGFLLEDNDTVIFKTSYVNSSNIGNNMYPCNVTNELFASNISNATAPDQYGCNDLEGYFTLIGTFFTNSGTGIYSHNSCDIITLAKRFYVSIGPSDGNYSGGNIFPYEYRSWNIDDSVTIKLPGEYELIDYTYSLSATGGNNTTVTSPAFSLNPIGGNISDEFKFYTGLLFDDSVTRSDDGYTALSYFYLKPTCNTPKDSSQAVTITFTSAGNMVDSGSLTKNYNTTHWLRYDAPRIEVQSLLPSINVYDSIAEWDLNVSNTSNVSDAENFWIAAPSISGITVTQLYDVTNSTFITPTANGIYELGSLPFASQRVFKIYGTFNTCQRDSIIVKTGWGCQGYPVDLASYTCPTNDIIFYTLPKTPSLETIISSANDSINLCDTSSYTVKIRNIQTGNAYNTVLTGLLPNGITIIPNSTQIKIPGQTSFVNFNNPTNPTGNIWEWNLDTNTIEGIQTSKNDAEITFKFISDCDFVSGSQFSFYSTGNAACPYTSTSATASSSPLVIKDAIQPYKTDIRIITDYISPCKGNTPFGIYIKNNGPLPFTANDSIYIELPLDVNFVNGSFNGLYNAPANGTPTVNTQNIYEVLTWHLPNGVAVGDSVLFSFEAKANKDSLDCSILRVRAYSTSTSTANCSATSSSCTINTVTGDTSRNVFVYKSYLALSNNNSTSILNAPNGEIGYVSFDIYNTGDTISAGETTYASYYWDRDNNGVLSPADTNFLTTSNIQEIVGSNATTTFLDTINIPAGYVCNIIVVLDSNENSCICSSVQLPLTFDLKQSLEDTSVCSNTPVLYSYDSVNSYTYNWTPTSNLNAYNLANPTFTYNNITNQIDTTEYYIEIDRGGCLGYDTIEISTYPELNPDAGLNDSTCNPNYTLNGNIPRVFENGIWLSSPTNPSPLTFSDSSINNSSISGFVEGVYELYWGHFNGFCDTTYDTVLIYAFDIPFADAGNNDSLCSFYTYTFNANAPIGTASGLWTQEALNPSAATFDYDTSNNANITGLIEGTYYFYWTVSNGSCPSATDTIMMDVFDLPTSNAGLDDSLCGVYTYTLNANIPVGRSTGVWTQNIANTTTAIFDYDTAYNANISGLTEGSYEFYWTVSNGNCTPVIDTIVIEVYDTPISDAGQNDSICNLFTYTLDANLPLGRSTGVWRAVSGPNTPTFTNAIVNNTSVTGLIEGTYEFSWTVSNGNCNTISDTVIIDVFNTPTSNAGLDDSLCNTYTYTLNGNQPIGRERGRWIQDLTDISGAMIDYDTAYNANLSGLVEGTYHFYWIVSSGNCIPAIDTVVIDVFDQPTADAGINDSICGALNYTLNAVQPTGRATGEWTLSALNPTVINFSSNTQYNATISNFIEGSYELYWTVSNGNCTSVSDTLILEFYDTPNPNAGIDDSLCNIYTYTLNANQPIGRARGLWTQDIANTSVATIDYDTAYNANISALTEGTYTFYWTINNGSCTPLTDTVVIDVFDTPTANAGIDDSLCNIYTYSLNGNLPTGRATGFWTQALTNPTGAIITSPTVNNSSIIDLTEGTYELYWTVSNGNCTPVIDTVIIDVFNEPNANAGNDTILCEQTDFTFNANLPLGRASGVWTQNNTNPSVITFGNNILNTTTITGLTNGIYKFYWTVSNGNCTDAIDSITLFNHPKPVANFASSEIEICEEECIDFNASLSTVDPLLGDNLINYKWNFGNGSGDNVTRTNCYNDSGMYSVSLIVEASSGCKDTITQNNYITVNPLPDANFSYLPTNPMIFEDVKFADVSTNQIAVREFTISDGSAYYSSSFNHSFRDTGYFNLSLFVENIYGCTDSIEESIYIKNRLFTYMPNSFSPNGDGINEVFTPNIQYVVEDEYLFIVFNRWGEKIFETNKVGLGWDGKFNNEMSQIDTYVWKVNFRVKNDPELQTMTGHVTLIR